jgi:hypothetical protein
MAQLINMKCDCDEGNIPGNNYPGGLMLYIDEDQCEALGILKTMAAGSKVSISAIAVVTSATESLEKDGDDAGNDVRLQLQITDMSVSIAGVMNNAANMLYGKGD